MQKLTWRFHPMKTFSHMTAAWTALCWSAWKCGFGCSFSGPDSRLAPKGLLMKAGKRKFYVQNLFKLNELKNAYHDLFTFTLGVFGGGSGILYLSMQAGQVVCFRWILMFSLSEVLTFFLLNFGSEMEL